MTLSGQLTGIGHRELPGGNDHQTAAIAGRHSHQLLLAEKLPPLPRGTTFFDECAHALLRITRHGVRHHHFLSVGIGFGLIEINLGVKSLLADPHNQGACLRDSAG